MNLTNASSIGVLPHHCSTLVVENSFQAKVIKTIAFSVILSMSLFGNIFLVAVVYRHRKIGMLTTTNCLIVNMAISDLIVPCFAVPNKLYNLMEDSDFRWLFGGLEGLILCKFMNFLLDVSTAVSIQSLVAIAMDRFYGVMFPFKAVRHKNARVCKIVIPLIWFNSIALHGIYFYTFRVYPLGENVYCLLDWRPLARTEDAQMPFYMAQFSLLYVCPLLVIAYLYGCIVNRLRKSAASQCYNKSTRRKASENYRNRKVTKMCLMAVLVFALCWAPIHIYGLCFHFVWNWTIPCGIEEVTFFVFFVAYSYAAINPCIFFIFNESFRRGLVRVVCCEKVKATRTPSSSWRSRSTSGFVKVMDVGNSNAKNTLV